MLLIATTWLVLRGLLGPIFRLLARGRAWNAADLLDRTTYTLMGLALTLFWSLPFRYLQDLFGLPDLNSGPEMLFISGILLVSGAVLVIMYNTDLLLRLILLILGRSRRFAPVLRMAIAYPLSNRFRTGMTIAIFAVVTLPVELNASARAKKLLYQYNIVDQRELAGVNKVLNAAAWTYVVAALAALVQVLYWATLVMGRRR